jgi:hydrogenase-1 operon protein HyaF
MDKPIDIPVTVPLGPGSQPEGELALDFMASPGPMYTRELVSLPEPEDLDTRPAARAALRTLHEQLGRYRVGGPALRVDLDALEPRDLDLVTQVLGEGEVSVTVRREGLHLAVQEAVLTGVWHVRALDAHGRVRSEHLEVADIPSAVRAHSFGGDRRLDLDFSALPEGVQNAPALLTEIADKLVAGGGAPHVINLTLLPLTPQDLIYLGERLGVGPTTLLSRGYGNCRIGATAKDRVWWVKYFNAQDVLILNTIEITEVPEVALAAPEDLEESRRRLGEILEMYR